MSNKRPAPQVHASRQNQVPGEPKRKRQKPDNAGPKSFKKAHPVNELKSQIRSLKRLLERDDKLPATVRVEKERALQTAQHELEDTQRAKQKSDMIGRYHKARFFDKQKATKRLKRVRKELKACEDGGEGNRRELEERVHEGEVDVNYAQYFPLEQHYVSLFPRKKTNVDGEEVAEDEQQQSEESVQKGDGEMRRRVKQCMIEGTLEDLRHGRLDRRRKESEQASLGGTADKKKSHNDLGNKKGGRMSKNGELGEAHERMPDDGDAESDGGFSSELAFRKSLSSAFALSNKNFEWCFAVSSNPSALRPCSVGAVPLPSALVDRLKEEVAADECIACPGRPAHPSLPTVSSATNASQVHRPTAPQHLGWTPHAKK